MRSSADFGAHDPDAARNAIIAAHPFVTNLPDGFSCGCGWTGDSEAAWRQHVLAAVQAATAQPAAQAAAEPDQCSNCRFVFKGVGSNHLCRREPPKVWGDKPGNSGFPFTLAADWCGEYKRKKGA